MAGLRSTSNGLQVAVDGQFYGRMTIVQLYILDDYYFHDHVFVYSEIILWLRTIFVYTVSVLHQTLILLGVLYHK